MTATDDGDLLNAARRHYENFPVVARFLPRKLREDIGAIYAFARAADDIADEGTAPPETRRAALARYGARLDAIDAGEEPTDPVFGRIARLVHARVLTTSPLRDLLSAFEQDTRVTRYATFDEVRDYCRRSADPVGRLVLALTGNDTPNLVAASDCACTALQLVNFLQDVGEDYARGRVYLPQDEMRAYSVDETHLRERRFDAAWSALIEHQIARIETLFVRAAPLAAVRGPIGIQLRMTLAGGRLVLAKLGKRNRHGFIGGQRLRAHDWVRMVVSSFIRIRL